MLEAERDALIAKLAPAEQAALLTLDPALAFPSYWLDHDIHNHPGGLADDISAFVYQAAVGTGGVVGRPQLHERFARAALARTEFRAPARILDLGCGYGRSTVAFAAMTRGVEVTGIDLSASCLKLATIEVPADLRGRVTYRQANAEAPPMPDEAFDVVTSTMLLHELPRGALLSVIAEILTFCPRPIRCCAFFTTGTACATTNRSCAILLNWTSWPLTGMQASTMSRSSPSPRPMACWTDRPPNGGCPGP
jgi:SAM-dependent methyltransferase